MLDKYKDGDKLEMVIMAFESLENIDNDNRFYF